MHFFGPPLFYGPFRRARQGVVPGRGGPGGSSWDRSPKGWRCTRCPRGRAWRPRWPHTACGPSPRAISGTSASRARAQGCTSWSGVRGEVVVVLATGYTAHTADREVIEAAVLKRVAVPWPSQEPHSQTLAVRLTANRCRKKTWFALDKWGG